VGTLVRQQELLVVRHQLVAHGGCLVVLRVVGQLLKRTSFSIFDVDGTQQNVGQQAPSNLRNADNICTVTRCEVRLQSLSNAAQQTLPEVLLGEK
jgi:hypothetical protein